ncbi:MAG TPA: methyltransferase domain-containing protein [Phenylobacterium sp.]|nr:methyltransferase domain-containing protein [Phenylobacterium sp.]
MTLLRTFVSLNVAVSEALDRVLPPALRRDGNVDFRAQALPSVLKPGALIYDLGGGSRPCISAEEKQRHDQRVVGLDISAEELAAAPAGVYDTAIAADLCSFVGPGDGDVAICQATLEHVPDTAGAIRAIASCMAPGGRSALFAPCRNAVFARLNLALPEDFKRRMLFAVFPHKAEGHDGFKAYYNRCTPREIEQLAAANGLVVEQRRLFWVSSYFKAFVPAFLLWRAWQGVSWLVMRDQAAEAFWYILRKPLREEAVAA